VRGNRGRDGSYSNFPSPIHRFNRSVGHGGKIKILFHLYLQVPTANRKKRKKMETGWKKKRKAGKKNSSKGQVGGREN
jgi:hypothetical protein